MEELKVVDDVKEIENVEEVDTLEEERKTDASVLDLLLATDISKFKVKSQKVEIPRLSNATGQPFILELRQVPINLEQDIEDRYNKVSYNDDGEVEFDANPFESRKMLLVESVYVDNKQLFKQSSIMKKFRAKTPTHLVEKLLTKGEISKLYNVYRTVVGFNKDSVKEIKN